MKLTPPTTSATDKRWFGFAPIGIGPAVAVTILLCMLVLATSLLISGWIGARDALLHVAAQNARSVSRLVTEKAGRLLDPASAAIRQLAQDPITNATSIESRLGRLNGLSEELVANGLLASIYVGYANGDFILVRPLDQPAIRKRFQAPPRATFLVQSVTSQGGRRLGEHRFYTAGLELLARRDVPEYQFDPRSRPWFQDASKTNSTVLSRPYVFFSTQQVGITLSKLAADGHTVVGLDMLLDDLATTLGELRFVPNMELALIDPDGKVVAYPDLARILRREGESVSFQPVGALAGTGLAELMQADRDANGLATYLVKGERWLGLVEPFLVIPESTLRLMIAIPESALLSELQARRDRLMLVVTGLVGVLLLLGSWAGIALGRSLNGLTETARRISRFDFKTESATALPLREVQVLTEAVGQLGSTIEAFLDITGILATEPKVDTMLERVLTRFVEATRCEAAAVYRWQKDSRQMERGAAHGQTDQLPERFSYVSPVAGQTEASARTGSRRQAEFELRSRDGQLKGLLVLTHADDEAHAGPAFESFARRLSGMLAISIETRQLIISQKELLGAMIRLMADAIDAKSPYTGGHCERVPQLANMLVERLQAETEGPYADFCMSEDERYEFHLGAWLHDCGKVTSPEHIVDKATKLELIYNRIHEIRMRFEVLWRDAEIAHWQRLVAGEDAGASQARLDERLQRLQADFAFVADCNIGGEWMADAAVERLRAIGAQTWLRHFDNRIGLSREEAVRIQLAEPVSPTLPAQETLLADRPEHLVEWGDKRPPVGKDDPANRYGFDMVLPAQKQNMGELYNLSIRRGTLTAEDRFRINDHIVQTYIMLKGLPWPDDLARVPEIAATHHERMDGKGYPRRLPAERLSLIDRAMAVADIFEALTAADRPYKPAKTLSESLQIMARMCREQHIDCELFRYFLHSRLWQVFADQYMQPNQIDEVDVPAIEQIATAG
ncbi:HD domain-containing phosphohydrolase [Parachitinimonas caeni]|uniref:HD domain-containing phosphohydrolase n=1 Tax=Parachitinimonas caeni TaxID=3031301 RepID=A0ABT7DW84_9NEIS|nr:HD domain-containing phosphohydrolase [Parachitinimonas caeni]MDK2123368.1 HD domain-containing phosphohydrolase [Parachitinimonas caeni]